MWIGQYTIRENSQASLYATNKDPALYYPRLFLNLQLINKQTTIYGTVAKDQTG